MSKDMDIYLETYARFYEEVQYYHKKVISWLEKYSYVQEAVSEKGFLIKIVSCFIMNSTV